MNYGNSAFGEAVFGAGEGGGASPETPIGATSVSITFENRAGVLRANLTGLKWAFFDQANPGTLAAPVALGVAETTDASGVMVLNIAGTTLNAGGIGWLIVSNSDGTVNDDDFTFAGPVVVS